MTIKQISIPDWTQSDLDSRISQGQFPDGTTLSDIWLPSDWNGLQAEFDAKLDASTAASTYVPYTGATADVDLGNHKITANGKLPAPTNVSVTINYGNSGYSTYYTSHGYRIYAYKTLNSARVYSAPVDSDIVTDDGYGGGTYSYDLTLNFDASSGADGYVIFKYDSAAGYIFDYNIEVVSNTLSDSGPGGFYSGSFPTTNVTDLPAFNSDYGGAWLGQQRNPGYDDIDILMFGGLSGSSYRMKWSNASTGTNEIQFLNDAGGLLNLKVYTMTADSYAGTSYMSNYGSSFGTQYGAVYNGGASGVAVWNSGYLGYSTAPLKRSIFIPVQNAKLPTSNPARIDAADQNWRLLFDAATSQSALWQLLLPYDYASGLVVRLHFSMNATQSGTLAVVWRAYLAAITPNVDAVDVNAKSFASANSTTATLALNQTAGYVRQATITMTNADSAVANDFIMLKIDRDAASGSDTATGDAELIGITLEYTASTS